jgi:hypothetical protein
MWLKYNTPYNQLNETGLVTVPLLYLNNKIKTYENIKHNPVIIIYIE